MHNGFVVDTEGEKMSKSIGNVENLLDLTDHYDPRAYRMVLLQTHYRSPVRVSQDNIDAAVNALAGLDSFAARTAGVAVGAVPDQALIGQFRERMDNDLDSPTAMAVLFDSVRRGNAALDAGDAGLAGALAASVQEMCSAVGLVLKAAGDVPEDITAKAAALDAARAAKDFAAADALRGELQAGGWIVETTKLGTTVRR
jgi:cysteinyl-tRNA synthetase